MPRRENSVDGVSNIKRILLIRLVKIGDVLMTTPAVHALRRHFPDAKITYLTEASCKDVLLNNPDIDEVLVYGPRTPRDIFEGKASDLVISFHDGYETQMLCSLFEERSKLLLKAGRKKLDSIFKKVYHTSPKIKRGQDIKDIFLNPVRDLGVKIHDRETRIYLTEQEKSFSRRYLKRHNLDKYKILGIHPAGDLRPNLWGSKKFAALADALIKRYGFMVLVFQGPGEESVAREVCRRIKHKEKTFLVPVLPMRKYISLVSACQMFVAHDRGPMHIAASLGIKTVGIFTTSDALVWFPYSKEKGCYCLQKDNVNSISVAEALEVAERSLMG